MAAFPSLLRSGTTRAVLVLGSLAFKIGKGMRGRRCNLFERDTWREATAPRRRMLCPVLWCSPSGAVLVMPRAQPLTEQEAEDFRERDAFPDWDYMPDGPGQPWEFLEKAGDWGWYRGRLVALDYSAPALIEPADIEAMTRDEPPL